MRDERRERRRETKDVKGLRETAQRHEECKYFQVKVQGIRKSKKTQVLKFKGSKMRDFR
jgi:hypothetical protein